MKQLILQRLKFFDKKITQNEIDILLKYSHIVNLKKGEYFIRLNEKNSKIGVLISGILLATYISEKGKNEVARIYSLDNNNVIVSSHESFFYDIPSTENIIAISDTQIIYINKNDLNTIKAEYSEIDNIVQVIAEYSYVKLIQRVRDLQSLSAEERVKKYYQLYKPLFNKVNKKDLASYLAINRNDFTRILKKI